MAFIPVPGVAQVELVCTLYQQTIENTHYVQKPLGWSAVELIDLCSAFMGWVDTSLKTTWAQEVNFFLVRARDLTQNTDDGVELQVIPPVLGTVGGGSMPGGTALAVKRASGYTGRSSRGRVYHFGIPKVNQTGNDVTSAYRDAVVGVYTALAPALAAVDPNWQQVIVSRYSNGLPRVTGTWLPLQSWSADVNLDSQRRRLDERGA